MIISASFLVVGRATLDYLILIMNGAFRGDCRGTQPCSVILDRLRVRAKQGGLCNRALLLLMVKLLLPLLLLPLTNATRSTSLEVRKWRLTREGFRSYWLNHFTKLLRSGQFSRRGHLLLL